MVRYSILMPGTVVVKKGAVVEYAIVAEESVIGETPGWAPLPTAVRTGGLLSLPST